MFFRSLKMILLLVVLLLAACSPAPTAAPQPSVATDLPAAVAPAAPTLAPTASQPTATVPAADTPTAAPTAASAPAACTSPASLTPAMTEGPYFKAGSPERASLLESNTAGQKLVLTGFVWTAGCKPVAHALIEFWQADSAGAYDNAGYTLRGHQYSAADGSYRLDTIVPGLYPGRTEHIHVKVQAPAGPVLTTQLFFPGVVQNDSDGIFDARLLMKVDQATVWNASYDFVISNE